MPDMEAITAQGELFTSPDVDEARVFFAQKSWEMNDKRMSVTEAVQRFIHPGDYFASGGFGGIRISTAVLHEILRQRITGLGFSGHTATHDFEILASGKCFDTCDIAYVIGLERRGLYRSPGATLKAEPSAPPNGATQPCSGGTRQPPWGPLPAGTRLARDRHLPAQRRQRPSNARSPARPCWQSLRSSRMWA